MTRITDTQLARTLASRTTLNREALNRYSEEVASGFAVSVPGDSVNAGTISQYRDTLEKIKGYRTRVTTVTGMLDFQENVLTQANEIMVRAKEIASQAGNETNGTSERAQLANEIFELRDHLANLANSKYQGRYIYGGAADDAPPYNPLTYDNPASGPESTRYWFSGLTGTSTERSVAVTDDLSVTVNSPADDVFENGLRALEKLGRALSGFDTPRAPSESSGSAWTFPDDRALQTTAIQESIDALDTARSADIMPELVQVGARLKRLDTADSLLDLSQTSAEEIVNRMQNADITKSATNLTQAQTALQASLTVTSRVLNMSLLDYL